MYWENSDWLTPEQVLQRLGNSPARSVVIGLPSSQNSSFLKASPDAPGLVARAMLRDEGNPYAENGVDLSDSKLLQCLGVLGEEHAHCHDTLLRLSESAFAMGKAAVFIGGDHSITYPILAGLSSAIGAPHLVHFDAHPDLYDELQGNRMSHACPFARIMERKLARSLTQYGIRTMNPHQAQQVKSFGVTCHEMRHQASWAPPQSAGPCYVSIDLDALDPAFAAGVAHREPGGMSVRQVLDLLAAIPGPVIGGDVVEYNPAQDLDGMTAVVAAKLVRELVARILVDSGWK